jgi:hypothetical protein
MCNHLSAEAIPIKDQGVGWKLFILKPFKPEGTGKLTPLTNLPEAAITYIVADDGWVDWGSEYSEIPDYGFCFFLDKDEALRCKQLWTKDLYSPYPVILRKIEYQNGLGLNLEDGMITGEVFKVGLSRSFRLANQNGRYRL